MRRGLGILLPAPQGSAFNLRFRLRLSVDATYFVILNDVKDVNLLKIQDPSLRCPQNDNLPYPESCKRLVNFPTCQEITVMWQNILVWTIVAAVGFICLRWVYNTLFGQKGGGCSCGRAVCPLGQGGACPEAQEKAE